MMRSLVFGLIVLCVFASVSEVWSAPKPEHIRQGKAATALVVVPGRGFGSSFCIGAQGYFITNEHVVRGVPPDKTVSLVLYPSEKSERVLEARVVRVDPEADLALLQVKGAKDLPVLNLGASKNLVETAELVAFGYPYGTALAVKSKRKKKYPSISVNLGRITALRSSDDELVAIQTDVSINQGNSGGPMIDAEGNVVGVAVAAVRGAGTLNFAIPSDMVRKFISRPEIVFAPTPIAFEDREKEIDLALRVVTFDGLKGMFDVEISVDNGEDGKRVIRGASKDDGYVIRLRPLEPKNADSPKLPVEAVFSGGSARGIARDVKISVGDIETLLSEVSRFERNDEQWKVFFKSGRSVEAEVKLGDLSIDLGGASVKVADGLKSMIVYEPKLPPSELAYTLRVLRDGNELAKVDGYLRIGGPPPRKVAPPLDGMTEKPPAMGELMEGSNAAIDLPRKQITFDEASVKLKFREPFSSSTVAGSGRYFAFHLKKAKTVVILDILQGKFVHEIPGVPEDVLIAGGRDKLLLAFPGQRLIQRFSLDPFEREKTAALPGQGTTKKVLLGMNSRGPLLVCAEDAQFLELNSLAPMKIEGPVIGGIGNHGYRIDGNPEGTVFIGFITGLSPVAYERMRLIGNKTERDTFGSARSYNRCPIATADGSLMLSQGSALYSPTGKHLETKWLENCTLFATSDPRYFIAVRFAESSVKPDNGRQLTQIHVCTVADRRIVHTYTGLEEMAPHPELSKRIDPLRAIHTSEEPRFHYIPWANAIVTLNWFGESVTIQKFSLIEGLERTGIDYLFVDSIPPHRAIRGRTFKYKPVVTSKAGGVKLALESGPKDMALSAEGELRWDVPAHTDDATASVILRVNDRAGGELFHSFELTVEDTPMTVIERP